MKKHLVLIALLILTLNLTGFASEAKAQTNSCRLASFFGPNKGCALFLDEQSNTYYEYNSYLLDVRTSPCSTFKIPNTLIGLKHNIIQDENSIIKWDGQKRFFPVWNQDLNLQQAFAFSAVWYFEKISSQIGLEEMNKSLREINYGNNDVSSGGTFWIDASLKISPKEQVEFLKRLFNRQIKGYDDKEINILKSIMYRGDLKEGKLYGKTGTSKNNNNGWFVGFWENNGHRLYFALRLYGGNEATGPRAEKITRAILENKF